MSFNNFKSAPFDTSLLVLIGMTVYIVMNWSENYGDAHAQLQKSFITAWVSIKTGTLQIFVDYKHLELAYILTFFPR